MISDEIVEMTDNLVGTIKRIYNGKILPEINKNYVNIFSPEVNLTSSVLYTYQSILEQNIYNKELRGLIITRSSSTAYRDFLKSMNQSEPNNNWDIIEIIDKKSNKCCPNKSNLMVYNITGTGSKQLKNEIQKVISDFKPDVIMFDEPSNFGNTSAIIPIMNELFVCDILKYVSNILNGNTVIISYTHNIDHTFYDDSKSNIHINYQCKLIYEKLFDRGREVYLSLIELKVSSVETIDKKLMSSIKNMPIKKILIISKNNIESKRLNDFFVKKKLNQKIKVISFELLIFDPHINKSTKELLINVDCLMILDDALKNSHKYYQLASYLILSHDTQENSPLLVIEKHDKNLHQQLHRLNTLFYNSNQHCLDIYNEIIKKIETSKIKLDIEFNDIRKKKLEVQLGITQEDKDIQEQKNTYFIVTIPSLVPVGSQSTISQYYQAEAKLINELKLTRDELELEISSIKKNSRKKIDYSGPKWLSRKDKLEISGNKIGFAFEEKNTIIFCEILEINKFTRKTKRPFWNNKNNKDRNVLYLSSAIFQMKLSQFKQKVDLFPLDKPFGYMKKIVINLN